jgi:ribosomal protein S18 acetylase RimI-like enzyme
MATIKVRLLDEADWREYRRIRLESLQQSPAAFASTYDDEAALPDSAWQERMRTAHRLLATRDQQPVGVVSLGVEEADGTGEVAELWVAPEARSSGVAWRLVEAATERATALGLRTVSYWVSTENARALGFATNFGFRLTSERRTVAAHQQEFGDQEIALVMTLAPDSGTAPNPTAPRVRSQPGPG